MRSVPLSASRRAGRLNFTRSSRTALRSKLESVRALVAENDDQWAAPTVSAIVAPRAPSGLGRPVVVSRTV